MLLNCIGQNEPIESRSCFVSEPRSWVNAEEREQRQVGPGEAVRACKLYLCLGCVVGFKFARFRLSPQLGFPCSVHIPLCYVRCVYDAGTHTKKYVCNVHLLVLLQGILFPVWLVTVWLAVPIKHGSE